MLIFLQAFETEEDKAKFERLYKKYKSSMYKIAWNILKNERDAEDIVHESFWAIIENFDKINDVSCQKTWNYIAAIVRNKAINLYNSKKSHKNVCYEEETEETEAEKESMEESQGGAGRYIIKMKNGYAFSKAEKNLERSGLSYTTDSEGVEEWERDTEEGAYRLAIGLMVVLVGGLLIQLQGELWKERHQSFLEYMNTYGNGKQTMIKIYRKRRILFGFWGILGGMACYFIKAII